MLSRVAESLFWIARNTERAETLARLLDVTAAGSVDRGTHHREAVERQWEAVYTVAGIEPPEPGPRAHAADAIERIAFGAEDERRSVCACLRIARRNAVGVRAELTTEVWECLNGLYLFVEAQSPRALGPDGASSFLRSVRDTTQAFAGICDATLSHDDGWDFLVAGRYLERAWMTARILSAHDDGADSAHAWQRVLEACCASEPFARARRQSSDPADALAFLALSDVFPRSIRFCVREVDRALHRISGTPAGTYANEAERASGRISAALGYYSANEVSEDGARVFAGRAQRWLAEIGDAVTAAYFPRVPVA
ncbi:MAG: hypothetical protein QOI11_2092 [Candidatus Eremiobacteraeota bacterium]|jgi:uncharacterized alpha-E superfamily protein|nr:hypothetical protein [Candidatus Eremiobacteraeota bacterium]